MSVDGLIGLVVGVLSALRPTYEFIQAIVNAPQDAKNLEKDLYALISINELLKSELEMIKKERIVKSAEWLNSVQGTLEAEKDAAEGLNRKLVEGGKLKKKRFSLKRVKWALNSAETRDMIARLDRHRMWLNDLVNHHQRNPGQKGSQDSYEDAPPPAYSGERWDPESDVEGGDSVSELHAEVSDFDQEIIATPVNGSRRQRKRNEHFQRNAEIENANVGAEDSDSYWDNPPPQTYEYLDPKFNPFASQPPPVDKPKLSNRRRKKAERSRRADYDSAHAHANNITFHYVASSIVIVTVAVGTLVFMNLGTIAAVAA